MAKQDDNEMSIIEEYYNNRESLDISSKPENCNATCNFEEKLNLSMSMMDTASNDPYTFDPNILSIISEGEKIRKKNERKEFMIFLGVIILLISLLILITAIISEKVFVFYQIAVFILMPFSLIPLVNAAMKREA